MGSIDRRPAAAILNGAHTPLFFTVTPASSSLPIRPPDGFETQRLLARRPRESDAPAVFAAYANDPEATRYLAWRPYGDLAPLTEFLRLRAAGWENHDGEYAYLLCLRGTDTPIGSIGVILDGSKAMFGYVLGRPHWGRGYAA